MSGRRSLVATALLVLVAAQPVVAVATAPDAGASDAARAPRCTITGTPQKDRLVGTAHRDVICGLGGDDLLIGRGGDDLLIGGAGDDRLRGGGGSDTLTGGRGRDHLHGSGGDDRIAGGGGGDTALGGSGRDSLAGQQGDDDLTGGLQADHIDGGPGTNWCIVDPQDTSENCVYDQAPAQADQVTYSVDSVDASTAAQTVTVRIHVTDDTGVSMVSFRPDLSVPWMPRSTGAHLVSGDIRDGWWEGSLTFRESSRPGTYIPIVQTYDRVGRSNSQTFWDSSLPVVDANPDQSLPQVTLQKPTQAGSYDVRDGSVSVPVQARITDVGTGVDPDSLRLALWSPDPHGVRRVAYGGQLTLTSGNVHDGTWNGSVKLPQGVTGGVWTLQVVVADQASRGSDFAAEYWGPAMFGGPAMWSYRENHPFPDGLGSVAVVGSAADVDPPAVSGVTVTPGSVSTLSGPAQVTVTAHITDSGGSGVLVAGTMLRTADFSSAFLFGGLTLSSGTDQDGVWTGTVDLPQGTPPGTYYLAVDAYDNANNGRQYISSSYPSGSFPKLDTDPTVTVTNDGL